MFRIQFNSDTAGSLWFYSTDENNFNADIEDTNNFKSFKYKAKLLGNTKADEDNGILKYTTNVVPFKYLNNFWGPLEVIIGGHGLIAKQN